MMNAQNEQMYNKRIQGVKIKYEDDTTIIMKGGANISAQTLMMIEQAIESARKHGINLEPGVRNKADGNCSFESVLHNINF